jgi:SAM-dependent MidA family methyltransferase
LGVTYSDGELEIAKKESGKKLREEIEDLSVQIKRKFEDGFTSEVRLDLHKWFRSISSLIRNGSMIFIDYGYDRNDFYRPERSEGNMICHYQNQIIQDPLKNIGYQDISASVDFTQLANSAIEEGFFIDLFATQSMFLLSEQSLSMIEDIEKDEDRIMEIQKLKQLVMPNQMGDVFKCMILGKGISPDNFEELSHLTHTL